jgi:hypothetical protein
MNPHIQNLMSPYLSRSEIQELKLATLTFQTPICDPIGFQNHTGECWNDVIQEIFLFCDGLKEYSQSFLYFLKSETLEEIVSSRFVPHMEMGNSKKSQFIQAYIDYILLMKYRFITHYKYIQSEAQGIANTVRSHKRRMSAVCGIRSAKKMVTMFEAGSGIKAEHRNFVFTNLCQIFQIPFVVVPVRPDKPFDSTSVAFLFSSIVFESPECTSIGGHSVGALCCNGIWYWYDDNVGVQTIDLQTLELCFAESQFGFFYEADKVQFLRLKRKRVKEHPEDMSVTQFIDEGGLQVEISHKLVDGVWVPYTSKEIPDETRIFGIKAAEGVYCIRPKKTIAQIIQEKRSAVKTRKNRRR